VTSTQRRLPEVAAVNAPRAAIAIRNGHGALANQDRFQVRDVLNLEASAHLAVLENW